MLPLTIVFAEVLSFSGLLPELINSRAAMLGMLAAFGAELSTREPVFLQVRYHAQLLIYDFSYYPVYLACYSCFACCQQCYLFEFCARCATAYLLCNILQQDVCTEIY